MSFEAEIEAVWVAEARLAEPVVDLCAVVDVNEVSNVLLVRLVLLVVDENKDWPVVEDSTEEINSDTEEEAVLLVLDILCKRRRD